MNDFSVKNEIVDMVSSIDNHEILMFLYVLVQDAFNDSLNQQDLQQLPVAPTTIAYMT